MAFLWHPEFEQGNYHKVVDALLDQKKSKAAREKYLASLIGALCFLGRLDDAADLFELAKKQSHQMRTASLFFLGIGLTRQSNYEKGKHTFDTNAAKSGKTPIERFFVHQGNAFYLFSTGRMNACLLEAEKSRKAALAAGDLFARSLATDMLGHTYVKLGEIHKGIELLKESEKLARKLGNINITRAINISLENYCAEYGLHEGFEALEKILKSANTENNYSLAEVALELARQYTLRGLFHRASEVLEFSAPLIYANKNRRQEIKLNLRLAEISFRRGDSFGAKHFLWFSSRMRHNEPDSEYELISLGIERKIALQQNNLAELEKINKRWELLGKEFSSARNENLRARLGEKSANLENPEDLVHVAISRSKLAEELPEKLQPLLERSYLSLVAEELRLAPGKNTLAVLPKNLGLFVQNNEGLIWNRDPITPLQRKILMLLTRSGQMNRHISKEALVEQIWGYRYDSLRHDSMVYTAISSLRKILGDAGKWLLVTDDSAYQFQAEIVWSEEIKNPQEEPLVSAVQNLPEHYFSLNHRQIEILGLLQKNKYLSVTDCEKKFGISEATAFRDLSALQKEQYVVRIGKARATRYMLGNKGDSV